MAVSSCHAKELSAFTPGQSLLIFKTRTRQSSKDVYASLTLLLKSPGSQPSQRAIPSSPPAICSYDSNFFGAIPVAGESLDWEHAAALARHPAQGLHREMTQTCYLWLCATRRFMQGEPWTGCWSCLEMGLHLTEDLSCIVQIYIKSDPLRLWGSCFIWSVMQFKAVLALWV